MMAGHPNESTNIMIETTPMETKVMTALPLQEPFCLRTNPVQQVMRTECLVEHILKAGPLLNIRDLISCGELNLTWAEEVKKQGMRLGLQRVVVVKSTIRKLREHAANDDLNPLELRMGHVTTNNQALALRTFGDRFRDTIDTLSITIPNVVDGINPFALFPNLTSLTLNLHVLAKSDSIVPNLVLKKVKKLGITYKRYQKGKQSVSTALKKGLAVGILKMCPGLLTLRLDDQIHAPILKQLVKKRLCDNMTNLQVYTTNFQSGFTEYTQASQTGAPKTIKELTYPLTALDLEVYRGWPEWKENLGSILLKFAGTLEKLRIHRINWTLKQKVTVLTFPKMANLEALEITHGHDSGNKLNKHHVQLPIKFTFDEEVGNGGGINFREQFPKLIRLTLRHDMIQGCFELCKMFCPQGSVPSSTVKRMDTDINSGKALRQQFASVFPNADLAMYQEQGSPS